MARRPSGPATGLLKGGEEGTLPVQMIQPGVFEPRERLDGRELVALTNEARRTGIVGRVTVWRKRGDDGKYALAEGELRWRAASKTGLRTLPVTIYQVASRAEAERLTWLVRVQREHMSPMAEARTYARLLELRMTHEAIAAELSIDRSTVSHALRLLDLPAPLQRLVEMAALGRRKGRFLLCFQRWPRLQLWIAARAIAERWKVRRLERERPQHYGIDAPTPDELSVRRERRLAHELPFERACAEGRLLDWALVVDPTPGADAGIEAESAALLVGAFLEAAGADAAAVATIGHLRNTRWESELLIAISRIRELDQAVPETGDDGNVVGDDEEGANGAPSPRAISPREVWAGFLIALARTSVEQVWQLAIPASRSPSAETDITWAPPPTTRWRVG